MPFTKIKNTQIQINHKFTNFIYKNKSLSPNAYFFQNLETIKGGVCYFDSAYTT